MPDLDTNADLSIENKNVYERKESFDVETVADVQVQAYPKFPPLPPSDDADSIPAATEITSIETSNDTKQEIYEKEKFALFQSFRISLNALVDKYAGAGEPIEDGNIDLDKFCQTVEHCLLHGCKSRNRWSLGRKRSFWDLVLMLVKLVGPENARSTSNLLRNIQQIESLKTDIARCRAWIRMALMEQTFADHIRVICESRQVLVDFYEPWAFIRSGDITAQVTGLSMGLNALDFNICFKGDALSSMSDTIDWKTYFGDHVEIASTSRAASIISTTGTSLAGTLLRESSSDDPTLASRLQKRMLQLTEQNSFLQHQARASNAKTLQVQAENSEYSINYSAAQHELSEQVQTIVDLQSTNASLQDEMSRLQRAHALEKSHASEKLVMVKCERQASSMKVADMMAKLEARDLDTANLRITIESHELRIAELESSNAHQSEVLRVTQERLITAIKSKDEVIKACDRDKEKLHNCLAGLATQKLQITLLENQIVQKDTLAARNTQLQADISHLRAKLQTLEVESVISDTAHTHDEDLVSLRQEIFLQKIQLEEALQESQTCLSTIEMLKVENAQLLTAMQSKEHAMVELAEELVRQQVTSHLRSESLLQQNRRVWKNDGEALNCGKCRTQFTVSVRKHHCRICGNIFCHDCCNNWYKIPGSPPPSRLCDNCATRRLQIL